MCVGSGGGVARCVLVQGFGLVMDLDVLIVIRRNPNRRRHIKCCLRAACSNTLLLEDPF